MNDKESDSSVDCSSSEHDTNDETPMNSSKRAREKRKSVNPRRKKARSAKNAKSSSDNADDNTQTTENIEDVTDTYNLATVEGQLASNPDLDLELAKVQAKREYNRQNAARARVRNKERVEELQQKVAALTKTAEECQRENEMLRAQLKALTSSRESDNRGPAVAQLPAPYRDHFSMVPQLQQQQHTDVSVLLSLVQQGNNTSATPNIQQSRTINHLSPMTQFLMNPAHSEQQLRLLRGGTNQGVRPVDLSGYLQSGPTALPNTSSLASLTGGGGLLQGGSLPSDIRSSLNIGSSLNVGYLPGLPAGSSRPTFDQPGPGIEDSSESKVSHQDINSYVQGQQGNPLVRTVEEPSQTTSRVNYHQPPAGKDFSN